MSYKKVIIWIFICAVFYFLLNKGVVNVILYTIVTLSLSLYFFPVRPVLEIRKQKDGKPRAVGFILTSNLLLSVVLVFTVIRVYMPENELISTVSSLVYLFNGLFAFYNFFIRDDMDAAFLHFMISLCYIRY
jgi:hypothetical protein